MVSPSLSDSVQSDHNGRSSDYKKLYDHGSEVFNLFLRNDGVIPDEIFRFLGGLLTYDDPAAIMKGLVDNYPEMEGLTGSLHITTQERADDSKSFTIGEKLFGTQKEKKTLQEFNRTAVGLMCLKRVLMDEKDKFTECQPSNLKLNEDNRKKLRKLTLDVLGYDQHALEAMIYYLSVLDAFVSFIVINDLGKTKIFEDTIKDEFQKDFVDHDHLLAYGLRHKPQLSQSFSRVDKEYQEAMLEGLKCNVNVGRLVHGECPSGILDNIRGMDKKAYDFFMLHYLYDAAGALGHGVQNGSAVINNPTFERIRECFGLLEKVRSEKLTYDEAYDDYLNRNTERFGKFEISDQSDIVVARMITMLRLVDKHQISVLRDIYKDMDPSITSVLEYHMTKTGHGKDYAFLTTFFPAFLANLQRELKTINPETGLKDAMRIGLSILAEVYKKSDDFYADPSEKEGILICDMSKIAGAISNRESLAKLDAYDIEISRKGDGIQAIFVDKKNHIDG